MKELTLNEISLLEEMKSNCLKKGRYIDDKAKDKFKMLCHLEDFSIAYYELLDVIKEVREYIEKDTRWFDSGYAKTYGELCTCAGANDTRLEVLVNPSNLLEILDKVDKEKE